jgi:hypothetical protein
MKVGDLVQLSSYGENRQHNADCYGGWGFVKELYKGCTKYPILAHWYKPNGSEISSMRFHPRELKKFKADKK